MWSWFSGLLTGPIINGAVEAYKAKLASGQNERSIAADLAAKELLLEQRERELATQLLISEEGRWWIALPRALVTYSFAVFVAKCVVYDTVLGLGTTPPLGGDIQAWAGWVMALWFGGRSIEKVARILKR